jgi:hypothetical protein
MSDVSKLLDKMDCSFPQTRGTDTFSIINQTILFAVPRVLKDILLLFYN